MSTRRPSGLDDGSRSLFPPISSRRVLGGGAVGSGCSPMSVSIGPPHLACHASVHPSEGRHGQLRILSHLAGLPVLLEKGRTLGSQTWDAGLHRLVPLGGPQVEVNAVVGSGPTCSTQTFRQWTVVRDEEEDDGG